MTKNVIFKVKRRRRREGKTNYKKRLYLLKSKKPRFVVRVSGRKITAQVIKYEPKGDQNIVNTTSLELKRYGWKGTTRNVCAAYLTGVLCGKKALDKGVKEGILDVGLQTPIKGSNIFAVLKGFVDAGIKIPHDAKALPDEKRILGEHIEKHRNVKLNLSDVKEKILGSKAKVVKEEKEEEHAGEGKEEGK